MRLCVLFRYERQAHAIERGADHQVGVVDDKRTVDRNVQGPLALIEFPAIQALRAVPEVDAPMLNRSRGDFGFGCDLK